MKARPVIDAVGEARSNAEVFGELLTRLDLANAIGSKDKQMVVFDGKNGGAAHTQFDNHLPALHVCADWIAEKLA